MHVAHRGAPRLSIYGQQLLEKQRLRFQYNISERQLRNYYRRAAARHGDTGLNLMRLLESRIDALVLRAGFARTIYEARQLVSHGHIEANGRKVDVPSQRLDPGDIFAVRDSSRGMQSIDWALQDAAPPPYVRLNREGLSAELLREPQLDEIPVICEISRVVEFYSR
jgi:small subunit ribosomal protein S4